MSITVPETEIVATGWLRSRSFDMAMVVGLTMAAMAAGAVLAIQPVTFWLFFFVDSWFLGYPHVTSTFTRLIPDRAAVRRHWFLVFVLPLLVIAATTAVAVGIGVWAVATVYFYWQWFHTVRQGWGIAQLYRRKSGGLVRENQTLAEALFYLVPLWGLLHRLTTAPDHFLVPAMTLAVPAIPVWLANGVGAVACLGLAWWVVERAREARAGELAVLHTVFTASHYLIFITGYIVMDDLAGGWIVTNIWHTSQYLMLVWMFNENAAGAGGAYRKSVFWTLTGGNRPLFYFGFCFLAALPVYVVIAMLYGAAGNTTALIAAVVANQTLNFHHFIVDAVIWRKKRQPAGTPA